MLLLRILAGHPDIDVVTPSARSQAGMALEDADPGLPGRFRRSGAVGSTILAPDDAVQESADVVFSALPHGASADVCAPLLGKVPVIDLSADFRFSDEGRFQAAYGTAWPAPEFQRAAVYGLTEWHRDALAGASVVANPGCYPTASLMPLLPVVAAGVAIDGPIVIHALSGITGAGRTAKVNTLYGERTENANAYAPGTSHRHHAEISERIDLAAGKTRDILFTPHLVPLKQGMAVTTVVPTETPHLAVEALVQRYSGEPFVELTGTRPPETREVRGTNRIRIGWREEPRALILMSVMDNLWKGASGQAVQNMNVRFGLEETTGLLRDGDL
jgi:N-acetyl-gamma-glutamyl-phosphate reductase